MTALFNYFYKVDLTVATLISGSISTVSYSFVNKAIKNDSTIGDFYPILRSIGEISLIAGELLPEVSLSSIEIDNTIGSFGSNRKFSDVLQRYTPLEQSISIFIARVSNATDAVSSWTQIGQGVVSDWSASSADGNGSITFNVRAVKLTDTVLTLEVSRAIPGMINAPQSSLGRALPLLIGDYASEVIPVRITADGGINPQYAIATGLDSFIKQALDSASLYLKNDIGDWELLSFGLDNFDSSGATSGGTYTLNTHAGRAFQIKRLVLSTDPPSFPTLLVCGISLACRGNGLASSTARLIIAIQRYDPVTLQVLEEVATGSVNLANYNSQNASSTNPFNIKIALDKSVFLSRYEEYAISYTVSGFQVNDLSLHYTTNASYLGVEFVRNDTSANDSGGFAWKYISNTSNNLIGKLIIYEPTFFEAKAGSTQAGLTYSYFQLTSTIGVDSGQSIAPLDDTPLLVVDIGGSFKVSDSTVIEKPQELANLLSYKWATGSGWTDASTWDTTTLNSSHYAFLYKGATPTERSRVARGIFEGKTTYTTFLADLCRGTASRVGILPNGKMFMYPFGATATPVRDIPYADITAIEWKQGDISTVINRAVIKVGKTYTKAPRTFENSESTTGFQHSIDFSALNYPAVAGKVADSIKLYGNQDLDQGEFNIWPYNQSGGGYLTGNTFIFPLTLFDQGSILAEYYITRYGSPLTYCTFIVPFDRYSDLKMFDVITFTHVDFPAFYGTDPNARDGVVDTGGGSVTPVVNADGGNEMVRAETYRGLIEGVVYVLAQEHAPAIRLIVQVLLNQPHDPT